MVLIGTSVYFLKINLLLQSKTDLKIENKAIQDVNKNYHDKKESNDNESIVNDIKDQLTESASSFIATFYNDKNIHNRHIQKIINVTKEFIENDIILSLKK